MNRSVPTVRSYSFRSNHVSNNIRPTVPMSLVHIPNKKPKQTRRYDPHSDSPSYKLSMTPAITTSHTGKQIIPMLFLVFLRPKHIARVQSSYATPIQCMHGLQVKKPIQLFRTLTRLNARPADRQAHHPRNKCDTSTWDPWQ